MLGSLLTVMTGVPAEVPAVPWLTHIYCESVSLAPACPSLMTALLTGTNSSEICV